MTRSSSRAARKPLAEKPGGSGFSGAQTTAPRADATTTPNKPLSLALDEALVMFDHIAASHGLSHAEKVELAQSLSSRVNFLASMDLASGRAPSVPQPLEVMLASAHRSNENEPRSESATSGGSSRALPDEAPLRWRNRDTNSDTSTINPAKFVRMVYQDWIGRGMTRKHLNDLDPELYRALSVWEHRHPDDRIAELPTLAEVIDRQIAMLSDILTPGELRKLGSTLQTRHRRSKK